MWGCCPFVVFFCFLLLGVFGIKRKCVFHFSHYYYLFLSSSYDYPQNMSCFFLFSLFLCCCFLFFLSYHCSTATMVSFRSPLYLPMDQNPGTIQFTPRYFGFMDAHPSVMWYFIGVDHVWSIIMSTPDSLDCSIGSYSSSSQPSPIKPTKGHHGVYWSGDWRYLVLLFWTILGMIGWDDEPTSDSFPGFAEPMFVLIPLVESTI